MSDDARAALADALEDAIAFGHSLAAGGLGHSDAVYKGRDAWRDCPQTLCRRVQAILAAMPNWRLVPADAVPVDAEERHPEGCESCARPTTETGRRILAQFHGWPERPEYPWNLLDANDILAIENEARAVPVDAERPQPPSEP